MKHPKKVRHYSGASPETLLKRSLDYGGGRKGRSAHRRIMKLRVSDIYEAGWTITLSFKGEEIEY
jgi:hypothetical protein